MRRQRSLSNAIRNTLERPQTAADQHTKLIANNINSAAPLLLQVARESDLRPLVSHFSTPRFSMLPTPPLSYRRVFLSQPQRGDSRRFVTESHLKNEHWVSFLRGSLQWKRNGNRKGGWWKVQAVRFGLFNFFANFQGLTTKGGGGGGGVQYLQYFEAADTSVRYCFAPGGGYNNATIGGIKRHAHTLSRAIYSKCRLQCCGCSLRLFGFWFNCFVLLQPKKTL